MCSLNESWISFFPSMTNFLKNQLSEQQSPIVSDIQHFDLLQNLLKIVKLKTIF